MKKSYHGTSYYDNQIVLGLIQVGVTDQYLVVTFDIVLSKPNCTVTGVVQYTCTVHVSKKAFLCTCV